jgi:hypothetical protein
MQAGMAYLSEDRKNKACSGQDDHRNFIAPICQISPSLDPRDVLNRLTAQYTQQLDVRTPSLG